MRPSNKSRSRNKSGNPGSSLHNQQNRRNGGNIINRVFDSAGPDGKVRGTPQQIIDKYLGLARDAQLAGDRVATESFLQHAEHYSRILGEAQRQQNEQRVSGERDEGGRDDGGRDDGGRHDGGRGEQRDDGGRSDQRDGGGRDDRVDRASRNEPRETGERVPAFSSGFATIDPEDVEDPRDRPRERADAGTRDERPRRAAPSGDAQPKPGVNGTSHDGVETADAPAPVEAGPPKPETPKRTRTRRKAPPVETSTVDVPAD